MTPGAARRVLGPGRRADATSLPRARCLPMTRPRVFLCFAAAFALVACGDSGPADSESASTGAGPGTGGPGPGATSEADATTTAPTEGGSSSTGLDCPANAPPAAPTVVDPLPGRIDVLAADLSMTGSAFSDPDVGDAMGGIEAEIWRVKDGEVTKRVWHAEVDATGPVALTLADGEYDADPLEEWKDYVVRMRYRDEHGACSAYGPWSADLGFRTDDGSTALFDETVVRDFHLTIPPESWDKINSEASPPGCVPYARNYYTGTLRYEDQVFEGVGIKIKGGCGSSRDLGGKASFKVNLEWDDPEVPGCPEERRLMGENKFTFNNGVQDRSAANERLGYPLFRDLGVPAPRAASVRIFVNDELWGLYTHVETIDRRFLSRWFASKEGMLYEGTYWCDLVPQNVPPTNDDDSYCLTREFSPDACSGAAEPGADPEDYTLLRELVDQIQALPPGEFYPAVEQFFDYDRFLTTWAVEAVIDHWDNYAFSIKNNYRVYHDPTTDRWTLISTGIDQTFEDDQDPWSAEGVLAARCLQEEMCEAAFAARLAEVNDFFESQDLPGRQQEIVTQLSPFVMEDPRKEYDFQSFVNEHEAITDFIEQRPEQVRQRIEDHGF
jgi:spore coat protein CotH